MFKKFALVFIAAVVVLNVVIAIVALTSTRDRDLSLPDTAIDYQQAVLGGNYEGMWDLSASELREGLTREQFIERARIEAAPPDRMFDWTVLNESEGDIARAHTLIQLASGGTQTNRIMLRNIDGEWRITSYEEYDGPWPPVEPPLAESLSDS